MNISNIGDYIINEGSYTVLISVKSDKVILSSINSINNRELSFKYIRKFKPDLKNLQNIISEEYNNYKKFLDSSNKSSYIKNDNHLLES